MLGELPGEHVGAGKEPVARPQDGEDLHIGEADELFVRFLRIAHAVGGQEPAGGVHVQGLGVHQHAVHVEDDGLDSLEARATHPSASTRASSASATRWSAGACSVRRPSRLVW